jgi:hypothetical protein
MKGTFKLDNPDEVYATLTMTMTVGEWRIIKDGLMAGAPQPLVAVEVRNLIRDLLERAGQEFHGKQPQ